MSVNYSADYDIDQNLTENYTVRDLMVTNHNVYNVPPKNKLTNLTNLADALEMLNKEIGPFEINSAYRSPELQAVLRGETAAAAAGTSFHELGLAADIAPTGITPMMTYFGLIIGNKTVADQLGEIALNPYDGYIHISVKTATKQNLPMLVDINRKYNIMTAEEFLRYRIPPASWLGLASFAGLIGTSIWWFKFRKKRI